MENVKSEVLFEEANSDFDIVGVCIRVTQNRWWKRMRRGSSDGSSSFNLRNLMRIVRQDLANKLSRGLIFEVDIDSGSSDDIDKAVSEKLKALLSKQTREVGLSPHRPFLFLTVDVFSTVIVHLAINNLGDPLASRTAGLYLLQNSSHNSTMMRKAMSVDLRSCSHGERLRELVLQLIFDDVPEGIVSFFPYPTGLIYYEVLRDISRKKESSSSYSVEALVAQNIVPDLDDWMTKFWPEELYDTIRKQEILGQPVDLVDSIITSHQSEIATEPKVAWAMCEAARLGYEAIIKLLLRFNADPNGRFNPSMDETPLMQAVRTNRSEIVQILLEGGADPSIGIDGGKTAKDLAFELREELRKESGRTPPKISNDAIITLLEHPPVVPGPSLIAATSSSQPQDAESAQFVKPIPVESTLVSNIGCNQNFEGKIVDFTMNDNIEGHLPLSVNIRELIYSASPILHRDVTFRWIHLPANNVAWLKDLIHKYHSERMIPSGKESDKIVAPSNAKENTVPQGSKGKDKARADSPETIAVGVSDHDPNKQRLETSTAQAVSDESSVVDGSGFILDTNNWISQQGSSATSTMLRTPSFSSRVTVEETSKSAIVFIPYLHYEMYTSYEKTIEIIRSIRERGHREPYPSSHQKLMWAYVNNNGDLHCRRTLDQYYYPDIDTTTRDADQVVYREAKLRWEDENPIILMVDQMWIIIIDGDTIITSFPQRYKPSRVPTANEEADRKRKSNNRKSKPKTGFIAEDVGDLLGDIMKELRNKNREPLQNVHDFALFIISRATQLFLRANVVRHEKLQFVELFKSRIAQVRNTEARAFTALHDTLKRLPNKKDRSYENALKNALDGLIDIGTEVEQLKEVKDIRDELNILSHLLKDQISVLEQIGKHLETQAGNKSSTLKTELDGYLKNIKSMDDEADEAYKALNHLLDLKQKQANVSEAHFSRRQAEDSGRQSTTLMIFTITTVIFLPLSFLAAFYALQIKEFPQGPNGVQLPLSYATSRIFGYSFAASVPLLLIAFGLNELFNYFARIRAKKQLKKQNATNTSSVVRQTGVI